MVSPRENVTHKCVRTQVGPISNSSVAKEPAPNNNQTEHVQLNSWLIHQPQGRNTLHGTCTTDTGTLVLVHAERYVSHCVACPRQNKHSGGQRIEGVQDQDRLEIRPPSNPTISVRMKDRSFCHQVDSSIEAIHQLQIQKHTTTMLWVWTGAVWGDMPSPLSRRYQQSWTRCWQTRPITDFYRRK